MVRRACEDGHATLRWSQLVAQKQHKGKGVFQTVALSCCRHPPPSTCTPCAISHTHDTCPWCPLLTRLGVAGCAACRCCRTASPPLTWQPSSTQLL